jgi:hypothetical protein
MQSPDTQQPANSKSPWAGASWWVWLAWIERENGGGFVYGGAARSFHEPDWNDEAVFEIPGVGRLVVRQCTVADENFGLFRNQLAAATVDTLLSIEPSQCEPMAALERVAGLFFVLTARTHKIADHHKLNVCLLT